MPLFARNSADEGEGVDKPFDRREWILSLLYAQNQEGISEPVSGWTSLRLMLFLVDQKLQDEFGERSPFSFESSTVGPSDPHLPDVVSELLDEDLISKIEQDDTTEKEEKELFVLNMKGKDPAETLYRSLSEEKRKLLTWVKYSPSHDSRENLLASVYRKYSGMFDSVMKD